jgi:hypothetical protein
MKKINLRKEMKDLYETSAKKISIVNAPRMNFLMIDGIGDPNTSQSYQEAIEALYGVSYPLKFMVKKGALAIDYGVMPLEGLWWVDDMTQFNVEDKRDWKWKAMMMQPEFISADAVSEAISQVSEKKRLPALADLRFEAFTEGTAAQILHIGPFSEEGPTVEKLHRFIEDQGYVLSGRHHEIYLSDFRRAAPEKLRTIIRQPMVSRG